MTADSAVDVRVLRPPEVAVSDDVRRVPAGRQTQVLLHLVLQRGEVVSVDRLTEALWGERLPRDPDNALQYVVARLRRLLESPAGVAPTIERRGAGYVLLLDGRRCDVGRLEEAAARDDAAPHPLAAVLDEWRGEPFAAFPDDLLLRAEARRLVALHATVLARWAEAAVDEGDHDAVVTRLGAAVLDAPGDVDERLHRALARAHASAGRTVEALAVLDRLLETLAETLGLDPSPATSALRDAVLRGEVSSAPPARPRARHVAAPLDETVGRELEHSTVLGRLAAGRLVTITGPTGVGKSRLALDVAWELQSRGTDVVSVPLTDVQDPALVGPAVLAAAGVAENAAREVDDVIAAALDRRDVVVLLDGVEHLLPALADRVAGWLRRAADLRILVTSAARLDLRGEHVVDVAPLAVPVAAAPGDTASDPAAAAAHPAVRLFCVRAAALDPTFVEDDETLADVVRVVQAVDGLPLAIELAVGRARSIGVAPVADRLAGTLDVLGTGERDRPDRHRTLTAALDWSLSLLAEQDRHVFEHLAVLSDADLATVEEVTTGDASASDALGRLVDRSLVRRDAGGRFRVLRALRTHVWEELDDDRRTDVVVGLLAWAVRVVDRHAGELRGPQQLTALRVLDREAPNLRLALTFAAGPYGDHEALVSLLEGLGRYWDWRGRFAEAAHWFEVGRRSLTEAGIAPTGALQAWTAFAALALGDEDEARRLADEAVASGWVERWMEVPGGLVVRSVLRRRTGDLDGAEADAQAVLDHGTRRGRVWSRAWATDALAHVAAERGDVGRARAYAMRSLALFGEAGDERGRAWALTGLADAQRAAGDLSSAADAARTAARASLVVEDAHGLAWALDLLADAMPGDPDEPVLRGAAAQLRGEEADGDEGPAQRRGRRLASDGGLGTLLEARDDRQA